MRFTTALFLLMLFSFCRAEGDVPASQLLEVIKNATALTQKIFLNDEGTQATVAILDLVSKERALVWTSDMDIDCDGEPDDKCNENTDPWFYPAVAAGEGIYASKTPFYVLPNSFACKTYGVDLGSVGLTIYKDKVMYGPLLDKCAIANVIGEASYAMAQTLGVNPDPQFGGTSGPVVYIAFSGTAAKLGKADYSNHTKALTIGNTRAKELIAFFNVTGINTTAVAGINPKNFCIISLSALEVTAEGSHTVSVTNFKGQQVMRMHGVGVQSYPLADLPAGLYIVKFVTPAVTVSQRAVVY